MFIAFLLNTLYLSFPLTCVLAIRANARNGSLLERFVFGIALYQFLLLATGLTLGLTNHLKAAPYTISIACATSLLVVQGFRNPLRLSLSGTLRRVRTRRGAAALLLICILTIAFALELGFDFLHGTRHGDGLWYHIPRVMFWAQQGSFNAWATPVDASVGLPVGADLVLLHKVLLGLGWGGAGYVTFLLAAGAVACVYLAGLELGMRRWHATLSAVLFASFPAVGLRIWSVNSDIAAAFPVLASFVALRRIRNPGVGLAVFLLLNAMGIACKPTVAPPALILACVTLWSCRRKIAPLWKQALPHAAAVAGSGLAAASYWPVYAVFGDFLGGDYSRVHRASSVEEFAHGVAMHSASWILEPFGYLSRFKRDWEIEAVRSFYNALGARFETLPEIWRPHPGQDAGYTGLAAVVAVPLLLMGLPARVRNPAALIFLAAYLPLSGMIRPQPYFSRYNVVLLAGLALLWGGTKIFSRGASRWLLSAIAGVNVCALLGIVTINVYMHETKWSKPGGAYYYVSDEDREAIAKSLAGRPLVLITESSAAVSSMDALLPGPQIAFPLSYLICPVDGDWVQELRRSANRSTWLALVHNGRQSINPGPEFERSGSHTCPDIPIQELEEALAEAGWRRFRKGNPVDLWEFQGTRL